MRFLPRFLSIDDELYSPENCVEVINKARGSIRIILPDASVYFSDDELIISALKRAVDKGVSVQVAYHPSSEIKKIGILGIPGIRVSKIAEPRKRLVMSIDGKHALVQRAPIEIGRDAGIISYNADKLADEIDLKFEELVQV